jgi:hypothetical protein
MHEGELHEHRDAVAEPVPAPRMEEPHVEQPAREEAPRVEARAVESPSVEAPRAEAPRAEMPRYEAPRVDAKEILSSAGLQMVETDRSKAVQSLPEAEPVHLGRPRREKPVAPPTAETELVQVETRNK